MNRSEVSPERLKARKRAAVEYVIHDNIPYIAATDKAAAETLARQTLEDTSSLEIIQI